MTPINSANAQNVWVELCKATFTRERSSYASKEKLEATLSLLLY